jgi:hypothetical protein
MLASLRDLGAQAAQAGAAVEDAVVRVACDVERGVAAYDALVGAAVLLVATSVLTLVPRRETVTAQILSARDGHRLERIPGVAVRTRTVTTRFNGRKQRTEKYDVTFPAAPGRPAHKATCDFPPDATAPFPVSVGAPRRPACQTLWWNDCRLRARYGGVEYAVTRHDTASCEPPPAEGTFYYRDGTLTATNDEAYVVAGLRGVQLLAARAFAWNAARVALIPRYCDYDVAAALGARAPACAGFVAAYDAALRLDKAEDVYDLGERMQRTLGRVLGPEATRVVHGVSRVVRGQNAARLWYESHLADYELWRCATGRAGGAVGADAGAYLARMLGAYVLVLVPTAWLATRAVRRALPPLSKDAPWQATLRRLPVALGVLAGLVAGNWGPLALRAVYRRRLGLSALDVPRMVL